ncbi:sodium:calcium antiporter [Candidatus Microgenomates bacterium]|nr:sodium:calcium antiporter [Candidatus Microgenomates bacterium]
MLVFYLFLLLFFSFLLIKASDIIVDSLRKLSKSTHLSKFALTSFILALATSLPELFVGIAAALENKPSLSLGNVIGSNIANLSIVIGGAAFIGGTVNVVGKFLQKDIFYTFLAGSLPLVLLLDNTLSRVDGLILLVVYFWYVATVLKFREKISFLNGIIKRLGKREAEIELSWFFFGIILLIFSADMLVRVSYQLADFFHIPLFLIGLFLVALGTSLPELSFGIKAIRSHQTAMVFGNLLGSVVANSSLILGITALISPIKILYLQEYLLATIFFIFIFAVFYFFVRSKRRLERWEGGVLFLLYLLFAMVEFLKN